MLIRRSFSPWPRSRRRGRPSCRSMTHWHCAFSPHYVCGSRVVCMCVPCVCMCEAAGEGKAAVQGTAMASGACCGVTRLMRHWGDMGASGAPLIKIHRIHCCGSMRTKKESKTERRERKHTHKIIKIILLM